MALIEERGITLVGLSLSNLANAGVGQLDLPVDPRRGLDAALDTVRDRYGAAAITRAVLLGRNTGFEMPVLPD
jgi:DNA polymerase-4